MEALARLARDCRQCNLRNGCRGVVFGEGDPTATIMFVGEGPGQNEDELGRPFVGRAGQLLDKWLAAIGLKRAEVYITNVVKCRPPGNRTPTPEEARLCWPILRTQLRLIRPRILVCLGSPAVQALVHPSARITRMRGNWLERGNMKLLGTFHPAAVLRDLTKERAVEEDLRKLQAECARLGGSTQEGSGR
ncbi:MAG TPA: uracil-DNA glycosylase [Firmicutes bacterium]|nr:uracil-DNA glycosylase [Bacillota bacterium]